MAMHYGYYDQGTKRLRDALTNMNHVFSQFGNIFEGAKILDAGCGVGGSSIFLAKNFNAETVGITLSNKQVAKCKENAEKHGVSKQCLFDEQSYLSTNFPDNHFDFVWGIESVCYAYDKADFLKEAFRILKPGGTVMVADFFENDNEGIKIQKELMEKWTDTWAIKGYAGINEFENKMKNIGFSNIEKKDVTKNILKSIKRLYICAHIGLPITYIAQLLGYRTKVQTANTWSSFYQYKAWQKDNWRYMFFKASKV
jgi:cyclopropane fatty-acyl-phospholipid synthase-like methyltransferase